MNYGVREEAHAVILGRGYATSGSTYYKNLPSHVYTSNNK